MNTILQPNQYEISHQNLSLGNKLLEINELCLYHLAQKCHDRLSTDRPQKTLESVRTQTIQVQDKDYQVLQQAVQKAEQQIRKHIGIQHQMKICLQEIEDQLNDLTQANSQLKKQTQFLKKQLSLAKKKQIQLGKKFIQTQQQLQFFKQKLKINKPGSKLNTQPESSINHDTSRKSLKKSFDSNKQKNVKKPMFTKGAAYSKLGSRKTSKLGLIQNQIDINLHNFITLSTQIKKQPITKTQGKQIFWNKRLKNKESVNINDEKAGYSTIYNPQNQSLNISPRQLRKQQRQNELKNVYATNSRDVRRSYQSGNNQEIITRKKQRRDYSNADTYHIKRSLNVKQQADRSKSVVY